MGLLDDMRAGSAARVAAARASEPLPALRARAASIPPPPRFVPSDAGFDLIAELKLRSPSQGTLATNSDPLARLRGYAAGGAAIVSVLTEPSRFDGHLEHLRAASEALAPLGVPAMRKDFLVDPYQLYEARACGASGALLIVRMLSEAQLDEMLECARELGLFVLLEAFDSDDLARAASLAARRAPIDEQVLMGLNCRDLQSLEIDFERFAALRGGLPDRWPAVAESGVQSATDAAAVASLGYRLALVGTSLMRRADAAAAVVELLAAGRAATVPA